MKYLLDTNACIQHLRGHARVQARLASEGSATVAVCSVVRAELMFGVHRATNPQRASSNLLAFLLQLKSLPFDDVAADQAARVRSDLASRGTPIGPYDLQIAAIGLANGLTVVTHNTAEFARVPGLRTEHWQIG